MTALMVRLKHRIEIQEAVQTPNASGGFTTTYSPLMKVSAEFKESAGTQPIGSVNAGSSPTAKVIIRYVQGIEKDQFVYLLRKREKCRRFRILNMMNANYRHLVLSVEEVEEE